jgi:cobalamin synthase
LVGLPSLRPPQRTDGRTWYRWLYLLCIVMLVASLVPLVTTDGAGLDVGGRIAFTALTVLGIVMVFRIILAGRVASARQGDWQKRYINHVYFTYISLWEGFVILPALNLPLPQLTVPAVAVAVLLIGHMLIARYKRRILTA